MPGSIPPKIAKLLAEVPELRQYIETQMRSDYAKGEAGARLLGFDKDAVCPECGCKFNPKRAR